MAKAKPLGVHVTNYEVKSQDFPFHARSFYVMVHEWMLEHEFAPDAADPNFPETMYYETRQQDGRREIWCWWRNKYVPQNNPFYRYALNVNMHWLGAKDTDIVQNGRKLKLQKGEFWFSVQAVLEVDYQNKWRTHWLLKHLLETFWKRFIWKDLEKHRHTLYKTAYELRNDVMQFLQIRQPEQKPKSWWPAMGYVEN
jgi:hypothetical protein